MLSRQSLARSARLAVRQPGRAPTQQTRGLAAAVPASSGSYDVSEYGGLKVASRDGGAPTTTLAVVAKAGTRYQPLPGLTAGLEEFAFKNTHKRSALRITRESELLGGQLTSYHTREALVLEASFLRSDLPYFAELLAEVISQTKYTTHEFHEDVERVIHLKQTEIAHTAEAVALDAAHAVAFHTGLGSPLYPALSTPSKGYLGEGSIAAYAAAAYAKSNFALVADGAADANLSKWVEHFFKDVPASPSGPLALNVGASKYYGGESRTGLVGGNAMVIAFPGSSYSTYKAEVAVLAALIGGQSNIKWTPGFSLLAKTASPSAAAKTTNLSYSDAGLLTIQISGPAAAVRETAEAAAKALKSIAEGSTSKEDLAKAVAKAKFDALDGSQLRAAGLVAAGSGLLHSGKPFQVSEATKAIEAVTAEKLKSAAKALLDGKATVTAVGDLYVLPYAEELGLTV